MADLALTLSCPLTEEKYTSHQIDKIEDWLNFFINEKKMHVVVSLPLKRKEDLVHLKYDKEYFILNPVRIFDTCNMWSSGLFEALDKYQPCKYVFLWSADFEFSDESRLAAEKMLECNTSTDLVVGTIQAVGKKEDIDKFATNPLIKTWFPEEYKMLKSNGFTKPRSELLRFSVPFLKYALERRWYPTEQTVHLIFQCLWSRNKFQAMPISLPKINDDGNGREQPDVIHQVERMDIWLKEMWRDRQKELKREWWITREQPEKNVESFKTIMDAQDILLMDKTTMRRRNRRI